MSVWTVWGLGFGGQGLRLQNVSVLVVIGVRGSPEFRTSSWMGVVMGLALKNSMSKGVRSVLPLPQFPTPEP